MKNLKGFSFIELAIALAVIGVIVAAGASYLKTSVKSAKIRETQELVLKETLAIKNYAKTYMYIPNKAQLDAIISSPRDLFGSDLIYIPSLSLTKNNDNDKTSNFLCSATKTGLSITLCNDEACTASEKIDNVSYIVGSKGLDNAEQIQKSGDDNNTVVKIFATANSDDILRWSTLDEIKGSLGCSVASDSLRILNSELPPINKTNTADTNVVIFADNGDGKYSWCVSYDNASIVGRIQFEIVDKNGKRTGITFQGQNKCEGTFHDGYAMKVAPTDTYISKATTWFFYVYLKDGAGTVVRKKFVLSVF